MPSDSQTEVFCNVARFLPEAAARDPEHCAVKVPLPNRGAEQIAYLERSFAELENESNAAALHLQERGITRGMHVLLMVKPGLELILITFALFKLGAVPVVIDPGMGLKHFLNCVRRTQPKALIGIPLAQWLSRFFFNTFSSVGIRVKVGAGFLNTIKAFQEKMFSIAPTGERDLAAILFTSGSTGPPKGVCYEHGMFEAQVRLIQTQFSIEPGEVDLPMLPIFALFNPAMGMTTVVPEMNPSRPATVDPQKIVQAIQQNQVTNSFGSPVLWTKIGRYCQANAIQLPSIRRILIAGAAVSPELIRLLKSVLPQGEIHTPYGATESLPVATISGTQVVEQTWQRTEQGKGTCVGCLFPEIELRIIKISDDAITNWDQAEILPPGEIGEIVVKGPVVTQAYHALPKATKTSKIPEGERSWHRIGDIGYLDEQGWLWFCGRKAERVRLSNGETLYTDCCEGIVNQHSEVFRSALIGLGEPGQQKPALVIEAEKTCALSDEELIHSVKAFAGGFPALEAIETFFVHPSFPVDVRHNAKIHRLTLERFYEKKLGV